MSDEGTVGLGRWILFWAIALGGTSFDLVTKSIVFSKVSAPPATAVSVVPHILELHTSQNTGALWGFGAGLPYSSQIFAGLSVIAAVVICFWLFFLRAAASIVLTVALGLIMAGALGQLLRSPCLRIRPRFRPFSRRCDRLRLRHLQLRRQHAGRWRTDPRPFRLAAGAWLARTSRA